MIVYNSFICATEVKKYTFGNIYDVLMYIYDDFVFFPPASVLVF